MENISHTISREINLSHNHIFAEALCMTSVSVALSNTSAEEEMIFNDDNMTNNNITFYKMNRVKYL